MHRPRRSRRAAACVALTAALTATVIGSTTLAGPATGADAPAVAASATAASVPAVARGVIVTTTGTVDASRTAAVVERAVDASGVPVDVADTERSGRTTTVLFDRVAAAADLADVVERVADRPDVVAAAPDLLMRPATVAPVTPDDEYFTRQLSLWDQRQGIRSGGHATKAPALWRATRGARRSDGSPVVVAIIDTGVTDHPDLTHQLVPGYDFISDEARSGDGDGRDADPSDPGDFTRAGECASDEPAYASSWHGTHVAGIVAAEQGNGVGVSGTAPQARVQAVRALGRCGGWTSDLLDAVRWASGGHVDGVPDNPTPATVLNLSLGDYLTGETLRYHSLLCETWSDELLAARRRGALPVVAAGNEYGRASRAVPASCDGAVSVAASSEAGRKATYSNSGASVDITAPGGDSYYGARRGILSTVNLGSRSPTRAGYSSIGWSGTSMAAPAVAAAAALLQSLGVTSPDHVEAALESSVARFPSTDRRLKSVRFRDPGDKKLRTLDLNCTTQRCGSGLLDLSKVPAPLSATAPVAVLGAQSYTAAPGRWIAKPRAFGYQWYRDGEPISGARSATLARRADDAGHAITVRIRAPRPFQDIAQVSAPLVVPAG